jgi:type II secretory pathway pseudopilin PulG
MFCPRCGTSVGDTDRFCRWCGTATGFGGEAPAPPAAPSSGTAAANIALFAAGGMLLLLAVGGVAAFVAIPRLLNAAERHKQLRTIADMRRIAAAVEAYATDAQAYPDAGTIEELAALLEPAYIQAMPRTDGWGRALKYESWLQDEADEAPTLYALGSAGKDGAWERWDLVDTPEGTTRGFDADIVLINGAFIQFPEGMDPGRVEMRTDAPPGPGGTPPLPPRHV